MKPVALVIDRDAGTRKLLDILLSRYGFEVDRVGFPSEGVTLLGVVDYDFVLSDDDSIVRWISEHRPETMAHLMILSSATETHIARMQQEWADIPIVRKPFELADVIDAARNAATSHRPRVESSIEGFIRQSMTAGSKSGIIVKWSGDVLELVAKFGYEAGVVEEWFPMALNNPYPICMVIRHARPIWLASLSGAQAEYPLLAPIWQTNQSRAVAIAPIFRDGTVIGGAGWTFREPQRFTESEQRAWMAISETAAQFIRKDEATQSTTRAGA